MIKDTIDTNKKRRVDEVRTANDRQSSEKERMGTQRFKYSHKRRKRKS